MYDLIVMAFQSDSTRIATFCLAHDGDNRPFGEIGISQGHHDLSHHSNRLDKIQKVKEIDRWYVSQFARFLQKLQNTSDLDGNSILHTNLPLILAGAGGGTLTPGRYVKHASKPVTNLFLSIADRIGLPETDRFGDSTERLRDI